MEIKEEDMTKIKEKFWECWFASACKVISFQGIDREYEKRCFEKWYNANFVKVAE